MGDKLFDSCVLETFKKSEKLRECENTPEVMELRKQRDEYTRLSQECQKKIDEAILATHKTPDIVGKYIKITDSDCTIYGHVTKVDRLFRGIRIEFDVELRYDFYKAGLFYSVQTDGMCYDRDIEWDCLDSIKTIDKDAFLHEFKHYTDLIVERADRDETTDYM